MRAFRPAEAPRYRSAGGGACPRETGMRGVLWLAGGIIGAMLAAVLLHEGIVAAGRTQGGLGDTARATCAACHGM